MPTVCVSRWVAHLDLCGLSVCPRLKRIAQPGGRDAPASPSLPTDSPAVEASSHSPSYTHGIICLPKHRWDDAEARLILTWASLTSSCLYLLTMSLVRFSRKPDTVSNSWSTENTKHLSRSHSLLNKMICSSFLSLTSESRMNILDFRGGWIDFEIMGGV